MTFYLLCYCNNARQLNSHREPIIDAAVVYFVLPTRENVQRICEDCRAQLYDSHYFNFITPISRDLLEQLAKVTVETNCVAHVKKVKGVQKMVIANFVCCCRIRIFKLAGLWGLLSGVNVCVCVCM